MRLLVIQVAGLGHGLVQDFPDVFARLSGQFNPITSAFPAVTCTAQATFRTGMPAQAHGMVGNGLFLKDAAKVEFWNQSSRLVHGARLWESTHSNAGAVGMLFWQQSLGEKASVILSPAPVHKHGGGMIQDCYSKPDGLYAELVRRLGKGFNLMHYWGPLASAKSSEWISRATCEILNDPKLRPDTLLTYIPHLDYALQRRGPTPDARLRKDVEFVVDILDRLMRTAESIGYDTLIWGDYAITEARSVVYPNRILKNAGFFLDRNVAGRTYPDLHASSAVAVVDHQVAHVHVRDPDKRATIQQLFETSEGIDEVRTRPPQAHPNHGDLTLVAKDGAWFAYHWWEPQDDTKPPDYATHVDIHNKIGFDPCELFWGRIVPPGTSLDCQKVKGTHGRTQPHATYMTTCDNLPQRPTDLLELARCFLDRNDG